MFADALSKGDASLEDLLEATTILEDSTRRTRRVLGDTHPGISAMKYALEGAREALARARAS